MFNCQDMSASFVANVNQVGQEGWLNETHRLCLE